MKGKVVAGTLAGLGLVAWIGLGSQATLAADAPTYVGSAKCKPCHFKQYKSWAETKMGKSFELLRPGAGADAKTKAGVDPAKDHTKEAKCLGCHTVGHGKPGGFVSETETPGYMGVGCEMCHGPGSAYSEIMRTTKDYKKADILAAGLVSPPTEAQCKNCHNEESPFVEKGSVFDFEARKAQGTHEHFPLQNPQ